MYLSEALYKINEYKISSAPWCARSWMRFSGEKVMGYGEKENFI